MPDDDELEAFRAGVNCAVVLEVAGWQLDRRQSTRRALKYRRGAGKVLIINHDGHGWWDPLSDAKGDVFTLVQHLEPRLNFGQVRQVLRRYLGTSPSHVAEFRSGQGRGTNRAVAERWEIRRRLQPRSPTWRYLGGQRALPPEILDEAAIQDVVREGPHGSAWFAHRNGETVCHVEIRGPAYKGSLAGGQKTLFRFGRAEQPKVPTASAAGMAAEGGAGYRRMVITEAPIDALSVATIEDLPSGTLYAATGGGMGPGTIATLTALLADLAFLPDAVAVSATDANATGDRFAACHQDMAAGAGVDFARLRPPEGLDWNDVLQQGRRS